MLGAIRLPCLEERRGGYELALNGFQAAADKGIHCGVVLRRCDVCDGRRRVFLGFRDDWRDDRLRGLLGLPLRLWLRLRRLVLMASRARKQGKQGGRAERGEQLHADAFQPIARSRD